MNVRAADLALGERPIEYDDAWDDADWAEVIAEAEKDAEGEQYAFSTEAYPTHEEGMAALWKWMCTLGNGGSNETSSAAADNAGA
jgi:hypothetical protein